MKTEEKKEYDPETSLCVPHSNIWSKCEECQTNRAEVIAWHKAHPLNLEALFK